jgi:hypothetical protein
MSGRSCLAAAAIRGRPAVVRQVDDELEVGRSEAAGGRYVEIDDLPAWLIGAQAVLHAAQDTLDDVNVMFAAVKVSHAG